MKLLVFGNIHQPPFINNLLQILRAFEKAAEVRLVEPFRIAGFVPTGGATPARIPPESVAEALRGFEPDAVVCLAGALYLDRETRVQFPKKTIFVGCALSDPVGLDASITIAPEFDLFYTQDPAAVPLYQARGIQVRRCDPAVDPELYFPLEIAPEYDILFYGKWTPLRERILSELSSRFDVHVHAHAAETRWRFLTLPPLNDPESLREATNRARLQLEIATIDDIESARGMVRMTNRPQIAAACAVPTLIENFEFLRDFFEPGVEIETYTDLPDLMAYAAALLRDEPRRRAMGQAARARILRAHTWDHRARQILADLSKRAALQTSTARTTDR